MGVLADMVAFGREVLQLTGRVERLERGVDALSSEVRGELKEMDRRLAKIEVLIELAQGCRLRRDESDD